jgi:hypothetical protein
MVKRFVAELPRKQILCAGSELSTRVWWPLAQTMTLMLDPPPSTLPMLAVWPGR